MATEAQGHVESMSSRNYFAALKRGLTRMPSGKNTWNQLLASNRRRSKGNLNKLQIRLWHALDVAETGLHEAMRQADAEQIQKWLHVTSQLSSVYIKAVIDGDLEARVKALENARK